MTVLNVEYFNRFNMLHEGTRFIIVVGISIAIGCTLSIIACMFSEKDAKLLIWAVLSLLITFGIIVGVTNAVNTETDYISLKYVKIEDDSVPLEVFENWEIDDIKGDIYILAPRDGKKIKDEEKSK